MKVALDVSPIAETAFLQHRVRGTGFYTRRLKEGLLSTFPKEDFLFFSKGDTRPEADIYHYPYFEPFFLTVPFSKLHTTVVTVHDLTTLVFPSYFPPGLKGKAKWLIQKSLLKRIPAVITDSYASKKDILHYTGIPDERVSVIYLAAGEEFKKIKITGKEKENFLRKYDLPSRFVLYVGDATWNKNLPNLLAAMQKAKLPGVFVGNALQDKKNR